MTEHRDAATESSVRAVRDALVGRVPAGTRVVLAVSGGVDSMALLDAAADCVPERIAVVATFDHGTGEAATRAARLVEREAAARGLAVMAGRRALAGAGEAAWRDARWAFLRDVAARCGADAIATGHTRDDQIETVAMRLLRGAGARGLTGLAAAAPGIVRPLLGVGRADVERYATARGIRWIEDPSNRSTAFLRNRVRHDLLPALRRVRPSIDDELLRVGREAAEWRCDVDAFVDRFVSMRAGDDGGEFHVATGEIGGYDAEELAVLWPAIAARAGVRLDRRGTARLVAFTRKHATGAVVGAEMQLSGAIDVRADRGEIVLRARRPRACEVTGPDFMGEVPLVDGLAVGGWRLRRVTAPRASGDDGADGTWRACLPGDRSLTVRAWRAGDRMRAVEGRAARRVKRFFADARIPARERPGWPVVLAGEAIVWIPGVRRSDAATDRPGRPGVHYLCERIDG